MSRMGPDRARFGGDADGPESWVSTAVATDKSQRLFMYRDA